MSVRTVVHIVGAGVGLGANAVDTLLTVVTCRVEIMAQADRLMQKIKPMQKTRWKESTQTPSNFIAGNKAKTKTLCYTPITAHELDL